MFDYRRAQGDRQKIWGGVPQIYSKVEDIKLDKQINNTNNVINSDIEKKSRVYSFGVERIFEDEKLEQIFNDIESSDYMEEANKYYNAFNDILLQVSWNKEKNQPTLRFRYPQILGGCKLLYG